MKLDFEQNLYTIDWVTPYSLDGTRPFAINLTEDLKIEAIIKDEHGNQFTLKDTIDSLKYDYKYKYIGLYRCEAYYRVSLRLIRFISTHLRLQKTKSIVTFALSSE